MIFARNILGVICKWWISTTAAKMCVSGITECLLKEHLHLRPTFDLMQGTIQKVIVTLMHAKNKRWQFKAYRSNGCNFSLKQANVCCVYWTRSAEKKNCLFVHRWMKIVLRRLPWEKRSLCRAGFEMTGKPKPMRKERKRQIQREKATAHAPDEWGSTE